MIPYLGDELIIQALMREVEKLSTELGLKVITEGDLSLLPAPEFYDDWLNAVLIKLSEVNNMHTSRIETDPPINRLGSVWINTTYIFDIWMLRRFNQEEQDLDKNNRAFARRILEQLEMSKEVLDLVNANIGFTRVSMGKCVFDNPENTQFKRDSVLVSAMNCKFLINANFSRF